jgi:uncharacterized RDD family membrane protein YckC
VSELTLYPRSAAEREEAEGHADEDRAIGYGPSAGRYFITFLFGIFYIPLLLDCLWPLWGGRRQALHDKVANSIVVRV